METIFAGLITLLFSAWVWDLKVQLSTPSAARTSLAIGQGGTQHGSPSHQSSRPVQMSAKHAVSRPETSPEEPTAHGMARQNGVPMWIIE